MVTKRRVYDGVVGVLRRTFDGLKRTQLLYVVPFGRSFDRVLRVLEGYNKVLIEVLNYRESLCYIF